MKALGARSRWALFIFGGSVLSLALAAAFRSPVISEKLKKEPGITKEKLAHAIEGAGSFHHFPSEMDLPLERDKNVRAVIQYSFDPKLQESMEALFRSYGPDYGAFVAMDATTGRILAMVSYSRAGGAAGEENLALRSTFPSASVFKVVTAAAVIENQKYSANTVIPFNGRNHTLYRSAVLKDRVTRWTRYITLKDAFAKSVNTVFGKIGAFAVGPVEMRQYADRFGFNRSIASDMPMQMGRAPIPDDSWGLAEASSGYTRDNTMSPLQGALIAAAIANDGVMMEPYVVQSVHAMDGTSLYAAAPRVASITVDPHTAEEIRKLMRETVLRGTSKKAFRGFFKKEYAVLNVGGKTGSLTGMDPPGKYDWFVGYADGGMRRIAVAALTIHGKHWRVKSSYLARRAFETYFKGYLRDGNLADRN